MNLQCCTISKLRSRVSVFDSQQKQGSRKKCVCEIQMPPAVIESNEGKNFEVLYFDSTLPLGQVMSLRCEQNFDELTVQVWTLHVYLSLKYCTLYVNTKGQTDRWTIQWSDSPGGTLKPGHKNPISYYHLLRGIQTQYPATISLRHNIY